MMAAIGAKHRAGLIPEWLHACQTVDRIYKIFSGWNRILVNPENLGILSKVILP